MKRFTLIELLVVVAIIGILSSILLPSLAKARESGKIALCKSNQHQFYISAFTYADNNTEHFAAIRTNYVMYMFDSDTDGVNYFQNFIVC